MTPHDRAPIVGVIGGGQLARMMIAPAVELGLELRVLAEAPGMSAALAATQVGDYRDIDTVLSFARDVDVITFDHEHVPQDVLAALVAEGITVHPSPHALAVAQDKILMRRTLSELGLPVPDWAAVSDEAELDAFIREHAGRAVVKTPRGGYDGKGVRVVESAAEVSDWFTALNEDGNGGQLLVEELVEFRRELSQQIARRPSGEKQLWPVVETIQAGGVCSEVIAPAPNSAGRIADVCADIATRVADGIGVTGALAVELFETTDDRVLINELAMRPHNSGHWTQDGSSTSQFEQHLRCIMGLPLGLTAAEMGTLLFDQNESMYFAVYLADGRLLAGHPGLRLPALPESHAPYFTETDFQNQNLRAVVISRAQPTPFKVVVGQTTRSRGSQFDRLLFFSIAPQILLLGLLALWLRRTIQQDVQPLMDLELAVAQRDARDLTPVKVASRTRDVQQLSEAINALLARVGQTVRSQKEFAGNVAHELRTPLAGIKALTEYGLSHPDPQVWREQLQSIARSQERASHLIDQLLALALAQEAREVLQPLPLRLDEVARDALLRHLPRADALGVDLGGRGLDAPLQVLAQRALVEGVIDNLLDNALRYGRPTDDAPARVTVDIAQQADGAVRLSVLDNGPGIGAAERQQLLNRWSQGQAGEALGQGSGLGLAIVAEYARILGARLALEPGEDGRGLHASLLFQPSVG